MDYTIKIGGEAGQGIQTIGDTLSKVFSRSGYHVFTHQDYESRVRGGHNFYQIRVADRQITASRDGIDILVAFDSVTIPMHAGELTPGGVCLYDSTLQNESLDDPKFLDVPFASLAMESGGSKVMANSVATGAVLGMLGIGMEVFFDVLAETLKRKETLKANQKAAMAGRDKAVTDCLRCSFTAVPAGQPRMLIGVNESIGLGAILSGCKFYAAYPMTPSTGIMLFLAAKAKEYGIIVEQAEDEIAAINMALGASFAGVRSMTGTSGGGFALMVEGLSLAAMTETPIVIALAQRPGPATGLPTRTEQADLLFALYSAHGEFPRVIFAPGNPEQALHLTGKAFDLSQKYQVPALILTDQYLSDVQWTPEKFNVDTIVYHDYRVRGTDVEGIKKYRRHAYGSEDGVSPFAIPGDSSHVVVTDSDEHDEEGHLIEDAQTRVAMVNKRLRDKLPYIWEEMDQPLFYGNENPRYIIAGWGSLYGIMKEAVDVLSEKHRIAMLHFSEIYPLPSTRFLDILRRAQRTICIEQNATSQFARLIRTETNYLFDAHINRYDGRPFTVDTLTGELNAYLT